MFRVHVWTCAPFPNFKEKIRNETGLFANEFSRANLGCCNVTSSQFSANPWTCWGEFVRFKFFTSGWGSIYIRDPPPFGFVGGVGFVDENYPIRLFGLSFRKGRLQNFTDALSKGHQNRASILHSNLDAVTQWLVHSAGCHAEAGVVHVRRQLNTYM